MHYLRLFISIYTIGNLVQVTCPWKVENHVLGDCREPRVHVLERIRHALSIQIESAASIFVAGSYTVVSESAGYHR